MRTAQTEAEARTALARDSFDLVLCDFDLGAGGTSAALVRDLHARGAPRVAVVCGAAEDARELREEGVPVFAKPTELAEVLEKLNTEPRGC